MGQHEIVATLVFDDALCHAPLGLKRARELLGGIIAPGGLHCSAYVLLVEGLALGHDALDRWEKTQVANILIG